MSLLVITAAYKDTKASLSAALESRSPYKRAFLSLLALDLSALSAQRKQDLALMF